MSLSSRLIRLASARSVVALPAIHHNVVLLPHRAAALAFSTGSYNAGPSAIFDAAIPAASDASVLSPGDLAERLKSPHLALSDIHTYYPALIQRLNAVNQKQRRLSSLEERDFVSLFLVLATSGRAEDIQRIEEILHDMPNAFGVEPTVDMHTAIISSLIQLRSASIVKNWLKKMPALPGHFTPTREQFHMFLDAFIDIEPFDYTRNIVHSMRGLGCRPTNETFEILIRARWKTADKETNIPALASFSKIMDDMKQEDLSYSPSIESLLFESYVSRGHDLDAERVRNLYKAAFTPHPAEASNLTTASIQKELSNIAQKRGVGAAIALFKSLEDKYNLSPGMGASFILRSSRTLSDILLVEKELGITCNVKHWSVVISNAIRTGHLPDAISLYEEAKGAGIVPDAGLVSPIIKTLCRSGNRPPSDASLDRALQLYRDLVYVAPKTYRPRERKTMKDHATGPDLNIYQTLLRGLAASMNTTKYHPIAMSLIDDMKERHLATDDTLTTTALIILFMKNASSSSEALEVYDKFRSSLDARGYEYVLNAFTKLSFGEDVKVPSLVDYFRIVKDMRRAGIPLSIQVYTILLHQLKEVAIHVRKEDVSNASELRQDLIAAVRRTHDILTVDASVSPDAVVWNQLMDTYQRLGCFPDAYRVWDMMYVTGRFNHPSVSIILDACGYAGAWQQAIRIHENLSRDRFVYDLNNWNSWIECLCRLGRLNDALKVVCLEMGKEGSWPPTIENVEILLRFARRWNAEAEMLARVKHYVPELWEQLPDYVREPN